MPNPSFPFEGEHKNRLQLQESSADNRAFRYGDGLFESILVRNGKVWNRKGHLSRLLSGMGVLGFEFDRDEWTTLLDSTLDELSSEISATGFGRIRLQVYRAGGGAYLPEIDTPQLFHEIQELEGDPWQLSKQGQVGIYHDIPLAQSILSSVKSINALPYILAAKHARKQGWDDAILRSSSGFLAESSRANLFIVRSATLNTPSLKSGCLPGVMRAAVIEAARREGYDVAERPVSMRDLTDADEIFLTNAIRGLMPVQSIADTDWKSSGSGTAETLLKGVLKLDL